MIFRLICLIHLSFSLGKEAAEGYWISGSPTSAWGAEIA